MVEIQRAAGPRVMGPGESDEPSWGGPDAIDRGRDGAPLEATLAALDDALAALDALASRRAGEPHPLADARAPEAPTKRPDPDAADAEPTRSWASTSDPRETTRPLERSIATLRDPARARASLATLAARFGVPEGGFGGQVSLEHGGRPRLSWAMTRLFDEAHERALTANLRAAASIHPDRALLLAVTMREHPSSWTARGLARIDSYAEGGLDHLGGDLDALVGVVPPRVLARWEPAEPALGRERGRTHAIHPARIPAADQLVAYAATLRLREARFESHVREVFGAEAEALLARCAPDARRAWIQATFGRPGRTRYDEARQRFEVSAGPPHRERPSAFGALERIRSEARRTGAEPSLDAILTDPMLARYATFQRARTTALEARLLEDAGLARAAGEEP